MAQQPITAGMRFAALSGRLGLRRAAARASDRVGGGQHSPPSSHRTVRTDPYTALHGIFIRRLVSNQWGNLSVDLMNSPCSSNHWFGNMRSIAHVCDKAHQFRWLYAVRWAVSRLMPCLRIFAAIVRRRFIFRTSWTRTLRRMCASSVAS